MREMMRLVGHHIFQGHFNHQVCMNRYYPFCLLLTFLCFAGCGSVTSQHPDQQNRETQSASVRAAELEHQRSSTPPPAPAPVIIPAPAPAPVVAALPPPPPPPVAASAGIDEKSMSFGEGIIGIGKGGGGTGSGQGIGYGSGNGRGGVLPKKVTVNITATSSKKASDEKAKSMPNFPWPPPKASAREVIPDAFLRRTDHGIVLFNDVDSILRSALDNSGYSESSYFAVPGGFAIATRIEQINKNGIPKSGEERWALKSSPINPFTNFSAYVNALFKGNPGYYRVIVFIITSDGFSQGKTEPGKAEVERWFNEGFNILPTETGQSEYTDHYRCTALIYEIKITPQSSTVIPGSLTGKTHLVRSGIWSNLQPNAAQQ